jgi:hypothetical protein
MFEAFQKFFLLIVLKNIYNCVSLLSTFFLMYFLQQSLYNEATNELPLSRAPKKNTKFHFKSLQDEFDRKTTFPGTSHLLIS